MKKVFALLIVTCASWATAHAQGRLIINDDAYVTMDGGVFIVVDNANTNAVTTMGSGGNLVSEDEDNKLRWIIGTNTGAYVVPYTSNPATTNTKIPFTMNITAAATGAGHFDFSSYEASGNDLNVPWPSMVTHMNDALTGISNNTLFVVDRWWIADPVNYTAKPAVDMTFTYLDGANEFLGTNTIVESNLKAQRFNDGMGTWGVPPNGNYPMWGNVNTATNTVSNVAVVPADFFAAWVLVDGAQPLPVDLVNMVAECTGSEAEIDWMTATESNNDFFTIERSVDMMNWEVLTQIPSGGNSTSPTYYNWTDPNPISGTSYYRLKQTDLNGTDSEYFNPVAIEHCSDESDILVFDNGSGTISLGVNTEVEDQLVVGLYDMSGRQVVDANFFVQKGYQTFDLDNPDIATGMYMLRVQGKYTEFSKKVFLK